MLIYDHKCEQYGKDYLLVRTLAEHESKMPFSPSCKRQKGGPSLERVLHKNQ